MKFIILLILIIGINLQAQTFIVNDVVMTDTTSSLLDPEIDFYGNHYCWANQEGIWIGKIDKKTGDFIPENGKGFLIDSTPSFNGMHYVKIVRNGL